MNRDNIIPQYGTFKIGDIVTGYYAGYYRIRSIIESSYRHPGTGVPTPNVLVEAVMVADAKGKRPKKEPKPKEFSIGYCKHVTVDTVEQEFQTTLDAAMTLRDSILPFVKKQTY